MDFKQFREQRLKLKQQYGEQLANGVKSKAYLKAIAPLLRFSKLREDRFSSILLADWLADNPEWRPNK